MKYIIKFNFFEKIIMLSQRTLKIASYILEAMDQNDSAYIKRDDFEFILSKFIQTKKNVKVQKLIEFINKSNCTNLLLINKMEEDIKDINADSIKHNIYDLVDKMNEMGIYKTFMNYILGIVKFNSINIKLKKTTKRKINNIISDMNNMLNSIKLKHEKNKNIDKELKLALEVCKTVYSSSHDLPELKRKYKNQQNIKNIKWSHIIYDFLGDISDNRITYINYINEEDGSYIELSYNDKLKYIKQFYDKDKYFYNIDRNEVYEYYDKKPQWRKDILNILRKYFKFNNDKIIQLIEWCFGYDICDELYASCEWNVLDNK